jgi:hypothetical protein
VSACWFWSFLERLHDGFEGGAILGVFVLSRLIFVGEAAEGHDHGLMVLVLLGREIS